MDTNEMLRIVDLIADLKPYFRGIYASNSLPFRVTRYPSAFVSNTDPLEKKRFSLGCVLVQKRNRM